MGKEFLEADLISAISKIIGKDKGEITNLDILTYLSGKRVLLTGIGDNKKGFVVKYGKELEKMFLFDLSMEFKDFSFKKKHKILHFLNEFSFLNKENSVKRNDLSKIKAILAKGHVIVGLISKNKDELMPIIFIPNNTKTNEIIADIEENSKDDFYIDIVVILDGIGEK